MYRLAEALEGTDRSEFHEPAPVALSEMEQLKAREIAGLLIGKAQELAKMIDEPKDWTGKCISAGLKKTLSHVPGRLREKFGAAEILEPRTLDIAEVMVGLWGRMARVDIDAACVNGSPHARIALDIAVREETLEDFPLIGGVIRNLKIAVLKSIPPNTDKAVLYQALILALPEIQRILKIQFVTASMK